MVQANPQSKQSGHLLGSRGGLLSLHWRRSHNDRARQPERPLSMMPAAVRLDMRGAHLSALGDRSGADSRRSRCAPARPRIGASRMSAHDGRELTLSTQSSRSRCRSNRPVADVRRGPRRAADTAALQPKERCVGRRLLLVVGGCCLQPRADDDAGE